MTNFDRYIPAQLRTHLKRLITLGNLGIIPRLTLAFLSVAVLAATSNLIVENGVSIVELVTKPDARPGVNVAAEPPPEITVPGDAGLRVSASQIVLALGNFDKAVREHVAIHSRESAAQYTEAQAELTHRVSEYTAELARVSGESPHALQAGMRNHEKSAAALIKAASERRVLLASYSTIYTRMDVNLQGSIDRAWKIMGRVVARQSLLKLIAELNDIQKLFATRDLGAAAGGGLDRLIAAEQAFSTTLEGNETSLRRSQGAEWFLGMRNDFKLLTTARAALTSSEKRNGDLARAFSLERDRLEKVLSDALNNDTFPVPPAPNTVLAASDQEAEMLEPTPSPSQAYPISRNVEVQSPRRPLVAWISGIVLAVLAFICVATILSVVRPVRRLLAATTRLARGEDVAPLPPGGIRELDTLSVAFNEMARQLAAARAVNRDAHHCLEARIEERTRQLQELAERDPLTGLANRRQLFAALNASIGRAAAASRLVGAFFLDLDNFKNLNDSMGHAYGDRVLSAIARRLENTARPFGFAARLGGDEFMLVHEGAESIEEIVASGTLIMQAFHDPIQIDGRELIVSVSVGASIYPVHEQHAEGLLLAADVALFNAKALGRSQLTVFTPELLVKASAKFAIEQRLRRAIEKGEFELFYQPEISVQTLEVTAVEALIRWRMPDGSYCGPDDFLSVAEEFGLIIEISDWVLRTAIETASYWHRGPWPEARVAVNVSPRQFLDHGFVETLQHLLEEFNLPPRCLELELTESVLQTGPTTIAALARLRELGVAIALDDFGTGYSSMASLEQLPLTRIKLDRSLIARMDSNARSASIARATIGLCSELGLEVTAEGVERLEQFTALLGYRGMTLQGFLLARPVSRDYLPALLKRVPAHCQELLLMSKGLPAPVASATGGREDSRRAEQPRAASPAGRK